MIGSVTVRSLNMSYDEVGDQVLGTVDRYEDEKYAVSVEAVKAALATLVAM